MFTHASSAGVSHHGMLRAATKAAFVTAMVVAAGALAWQMSATTDSPRLTNTPSAMVAGQQTQQELPPDVALTVINSSGFEPAGIAHSRGRFRVVVQNRSGEGALDLRLDGEQSSRWREEHTLGQIQGWIATVELEPGTYTITEARHPAWVCRLTVTGN